MPPKRIGVIGSLNIDLIIKGQAPMEMEQLVQWGGTSKISMLIAGAVGYFTQNLNKLGCEVHLVSTISDDSFGAVIRNGLEKAKINHNYLSIETGTQSAIAIYMLLFGGSKRPMTYRLPTHNGFPPSLTDKQRDYLLDTDAVHCGGFLHFPNLWYTDVVDIFAEAQKRGIVTSLDAQFPLQPLPPPWSKVMEPLLKHTDTLFMDESEAIGITGATSPDEAIERLVKTSTSTIVVKRGEKGAVVLNKGKKIIQPVITPKKFVDSIGAGDSFDAGFLFALLRGDAVGSAATLAAYVASKSCEGVGGTETFPMLKDLPY